MIRLLRFLPLLAFLPFSPYVAPSASEESFRFPLAVGNRWEYRQTWTGMIDTVQSWSIESQTIWEITRTEPLGSSLAFVLEGTTLDTFPEADSLHYQVWYADTDSGLIELGYSNPGAASLTLKRVGLQHRLRVLQEMPVIEVPRSGSFPPIYPTPVILRYPLVAGAQWISPASDNYLEVRREVVGQETITVPAGMFVTYHVRTFLPGLDARYDSWYAAAGLIRREFRSENVWTDELGNETGRGWSMDRAELVAYRVEAFATTGEATTGAQATVDGGVTPRGGAEGATTVETTTWGQLKSRFSMRRRVSF